MVSGERLAAGDSRFDPAAREATVLFFRWFNYTGVCEKRVLSLLGLL
jgi:hypothetical protein